MGIHIDVKRHRFAAPFWYLVSSHVQIPYSIDNNVEYYQTKSHALTTELAGFKKMGDLPKCWLRPFRFLIPGPLAHHQHCVRDTHATAIGHSQLSTSPAV